MHRLRHGVATHLVDEGKVLKAQARLGHRDPATTLRHYADGSRLMTSMSPTTSIPSSMADRVRDCASVGFADPTYGIAPPWHSVPSPA